MKRTASIATVFTLAITFFAGLAQAESDGSRTVATIPFEFVVNGVTLPAGHYDFVGTTDGVVQIRDANGRTVFSSIGFPVQSNGVLGKSSIKFVSVNGHYFLNQIWNEAADMGREFGYGRSGMELTNPSIH